MPGRLFLLNGPPRSGKDTCGAMISSLLGNESCWSDKLSMELKERTHALYRLFRMDGKPLRHDFYELVKDRASVAFLGLTPRQAYIDAHERYWKPVHGADILGRLLMNRLRSDPRWSPELNLIITDAGDAPQCMPLVEVYGCVNSFRIQLDRAGCTWDNRRLFDLPGVQTLHLENPGDSFEELRSRIAALIL